MTFRLFPGKRYVRENLKGKKAKQQKSLKNKWQVCSRGGNWKQFAAKNFKAFPRYVRDQCLEAKRYFFGKDIEISILNKALKYCLENETLSFANLKDTYIFFEHEHEREDLAILTLSTDYQGDHEPLKVMARDLSVYKKIISSQGATNESL